MRISPIHVHERLRLLQISPLIRLAALGLAGDAIRPGWDYESGGYYAESRGQVEALREIGLEEKLITAVAWARLLGTAVVVLIDEGGNPATKQTATDFILTHEMDGTVGGIRPTAKDIDGNPTMFELNIMPYAGLSSGHTQIQRIEVRQESLIVFRGGYAPLSFWGLPELDSLVSLALMEEHIFRSTLRRVTLLAGGAMLIRGVGSTEEKDAIDSGLDTGLSSYDRVYAPEDVEFDWLQPADRATSEVKEIMELISCQAARVLQLPQALIDGRAEGTLSSARADLMRWDATVHNIQVKYTRPIEEVLEALVHRRVRIAWHPFLPKGMDTTERETGDQDEPAASETMPA